jgi:tRNA threonylcarbamoyladenosine biosynthesis protein TsaB
MKILTIRTDKPEAEIGLYDNESQCSYEVWTAHRELAETIHTKIRQLLDEQNLRLQQLDAVVAYKGPGSFTGLRIGLSVANALACSLRIPIVGVSGTDTWLERGLYDVLNQVDHKCVLPEYGAPVHITTPKK